MKKVMVEFYCRACEREEDLEHRQFVCPSCSSKDVFNCSFIVCDCGTKVYLSNPMTNYCSGCDRLYNSFGQELAPPEEWDEDDRYYSAGMNW